MRPKILQLLLEIGVREELVAREREVLPRVTHPFQHQALLLKCCLQQCGNTPQQCGCATCLHDNLRQKVTTHGQYQLANARHTVYLAHLFPSNEEFNGIWREPACQTPNNMEDPKNTTGALGLLYHKRCIPHYTHASASFSTCLVWVNEEAALR